jgi:hypothetical protein
MEVTMHGRGIVALPIRALALLRKRLQRRGLCLVPRP